MSGIKWAFRRVGIMGFVVSSLATVATLQIADGTASAAVGSGTRKHTICHRTHATTNPYRLITVSRSSIFNGNSGSFKNAGHTNGSHNQWPFDTLFPTDSVLDDNSNGVLSDTEIDDVYPDVGWDAGDTGIGVDSDTDLITEGDADGDGTRNSADTSFFGVGTPFESGGKLQVRLWTLAANGETRDNIHRSTWTYPPKEKRWGDIIPPFDDGGLSDYQNMDLDLDGDLDEVTALTFRSDGSPIFSPPGGLGCSSRTAKQFVDAECDGTYGVGEYYASEDDCLDAAFTDLDEQQADEDGLLRGRLGGGSFHTWWHDNGRKNKNDTFTDLDLLVAAAAADAPEATTLNCSQGNGTTISLTGRINPQGIASWVFFEWGLESDLSDADPEAASGNGLDVGNNFVLYGETADGYQASPTAEDQLMRVQTQQLDFEARQRVYYRVVVAVEQVVGADTLTTYTRGDIESCVVAGQNGTGGGGGGGEPPVTSAPATTETPTETSGPPLNDPPADPKKKNDDPKGPKDEGPDDITKKLSLDPKPNENDPSKGGTIEINKDPSLPPPQVTGCEIDNPDYECEIKYSGPEYNNPKTWEENGFGDECWKIDPGGYSYTLPDPPQPPSGTSGGVYSVVVVKAGSLTSTDPNFQVNTLFYDPSGNTAVWPDSNKDGVYNPGGRYGDKEISHIIFCVTYGSRSNTSTTGPATTAPATTSPSSTGPSTSGPATTAPATTAPATTAPATTTPATPRPPQVEVRPKAGVDPVPDLANLTIAVSVGTDEEVLIIPIDLTNFVFKNALPELPVTGSDTDTPRNLAIAMVLGGLVLYGFRRRLFVKI